MKRQKWLKSSFFLPSLLLLTACGTMTGEIYAAGQFESADFTANYYNVYSDSLLSANNVKDYQLDTSNSRYGSILDNDFTRNLMAQDVIRNINGASGLFNKLYGENSILNAYEATDEYYADNALGEISSSFRYGYFSKLTDGLAHCDGSGARVRIQTSPTGFGQVFAKELIDYSSFIISFRGGTNIPWGSEGIPSMSNADATAIVKLNLHFYVLNDDYRTYSQITFSRTVEVRTDDHGSNTNILQFYFADVMGDEVSLLDRASGFGLDYELLNHSYIMPGGVASDTPYQFALMTYETELPYSHWA